MHLPFPFLLTLGLAAAAFTRLATAHTVFTTLFIDDVNQGDGTCIRMSKEGSLSTHPIEGLDSDDMACGRDGQNAVAFTCPTPAGAKLTLEFREWADASQPGSIDESHVGPMAIYLKQVSDMETDSAAGPGWFKIWDEGYDTAAKKWATEKLMDNNGLFSINLPLGLPAGYYLARHEIITLQNVTDGKADAQFYVGCAQLFIQGASGGDLPSDKQVSIPGHVEGNEPGLTMNVYTEDPSTYRVVGPDVFFPAASTANTKARQTLEQTAGLIPDTCLLKNANWCGTEVPDFTDERSCWASADNCWEQLEECYDSAPPTGSKGCRIWQEEKCKVLQQACESRAFPGPPNKGQKLGGDVNEPIPGGELPPAINAGQEGGDGGRETTPTPTISASAAPSQTVVSRCKGSRRRAVL